MITMRGTQFYTDFRIAGKRVRRSLDTNDRRDALDMASNMKKRMERTGETTILTLREAIDKMFPEVWNRGKNAYTLKYTTKEILEYFGEEATLDTISYRRLHDFQMWLLDKGNSNATVNRKLACISKLLTHAVRRWQVLETKPPLPERMPETRGRIRVLTDEEEKKLLTVTTNQDAKFVFMFLIDTGCRRAEALTLEWQDVDWENKAVQLYSGNVKNKDGRMVPLVSRAFGVLQSLHKAGYDRPFPLAKHTVRWHWNVARKRMGMEDDPEFVLHILRHTFATRMVNRDIDLLVIQKWLGHKTLAMTQRYAKATDRKLLAIRDAMEGVAMTVTKPSKVSPDK